MAADELDVFCAFYFWPLCRCSVDYRVCDYQYLDNRSDAGAVGYPAILSAFLGFCFLRYCSRPARQALACRVDGKTYGREDFLGRVFRTDPVEGHDAPGRAFFFFSAGDFQLFRHDVSYLYYYRYPKSD